MPELAAPGLAPDIPVSARASSRRPARACAPRSRRRSGIVAGARFTYALCRPPGHHAGPGWLGGYCYLNTAAAAVQTLREGGVRPVGILDLDLHYPNGTSAIVARMTDVSLHSLHAWPVTNAPSQPGAPTHRARAARRVPERPRSRRLPRGGRRVARTRSPQSASVLVLSLGYDTVAGDPHGSWSFSPAIFARDRPSAGGLGAARLRRPGGRLRAGHARGVQPRVRDGLLDGCPGMSGLDPFRRRLDELDDQIARAARRALCDLPGDRALQARARHPDDAAATASTRCGRAISPVAPRSSCPPTSRPRSSSC